MLDQPRIKAILRNMVDRAGTSKRAAELCGVPASDMSLWTSDASDRNIPVDHLLLLDARVGHLFLEEVAADCGFDLKKRAVPGDVPILETIGHLSKSIGHLVLVVLKAAADGVFCPREKREIRDHVAPVKDGLHNLERAIS